LPLPGFALMLVDPPEETLRMSEPRSPQGAITFIIPGQRDGGKRGAGIETQTAPTGLRGHVKASVRVSARRTAGESVRVTAVPGEDVVVLQIAGGPTLMLHPENARDLLLGQGTSTRSARARNAAGTEDEVQVPAQLAWRTLEGAAPTATATRGSGFLGKVLLSVFEVVTGFKTEPLVDFATSAVLKHVDGQVDPGVYALRPESLPLLKGSGLKIDTVPEEAAAAGPLLVLLHGTFVDTHSTFGKLWVMFPQRVRELFQHYGGRVYALDHPTLGASPIANALTLVRSLPVGSRLHLATHSRGGLVAEVLARVAGRGGVSKADLAYFDGPDYAGQRTELQALGNEIARRRISVERVLRVACPARGTLLASKRLDAYLSVLRWALDRAQVPVLPSLLDFLGEVARRRADPKEIPGLAAMIADTPLVTWLNDAEEPVAGDLRVVAGDLQGDSVGSWLKTLLADAYYWTDNDVVVQTRSMYGGSPRLGGASFLLDQGGQVTHFNYFSNARTVDAVVAGLTQSQPQGFRAIGPLSWAGQDSGGLRTARRSGDGKPAAERPAVFVLPGILGSHLKAGDKRIWLSLRLIGGLKRLAYQPGGADQVLPDGPIGMVYDDLIDHLAATHEVIPFGFDWRRPIEEEARRLADAVDAAMDARSESMQPVRLMAHSMGGVVARTLQLERPKTWERMMANAGARLVMLGTPNGGSWAPMQVLSGDDTFGNALAAFGSPLRDRQARQLMAEMPGFLQLQASLLDERLGLGKAETWARIAAEDLQRVRDASWWHSQSNDGAIIPAYEWGLPPQAVLTQALNLRQRLDEQRDKVLPAFASKLLLVTGHAKFTPDGYEMGHDGFVYLNATDGGDGRVPLASALLPGVKTWTLDCEHGDLPDAEGAFDAFVELLVRGDTTRLQRLSAPAGVRGAGAVLPAAPAVVHVRSRPSRGRPLAVPAETQRAVFDVPGIAAAVASPDAGAQSALRVNVINGNLGFVREPLLVGHYRSSVLTGTELAIDRTVDGAMRASLNTGLYPDPPGTHQVFVNNGRDPGNPWRAPRPASVIVIGMGEEGKLREQELTFSVRQGVMAWSQRVAEDPDGAPATIAMASTLMGSGGLGMSPGGTARAIAQGVRDANERLARAGWPVVSELTLVELFLERASDAWRGLQVLETSSPGRFEIAPVIASGTGPLRRQIDSGYRSTDYDFISATTESDDRISFTLDTRRARTEVRAQSTQGKLLRELVARASTDTNEDPRLGRTLFQLLVPPELEPFLGGTSQMLLELDAGTATIPWELLDTQDERHQGADPRPWAIRAKLLRKLRKEHYREVMHDASAEDAVLVIGEPQCDLDKYPPLPGARAEAEAVAAQIGGAGGIGTERVTALVDSPDAASVINALLERRYRVVHIAGHGEPGMAGGVVLSGDTFLGPREIQTMRTVPELVFVNCCHLAKYDAGGTLRSGRDRPAADDFDRSVFAAGVADQLIEIGVRCVVAAGWAVEDAPAKIFATTFYSELFGGASFIDAVAHAREAAWAEGGNTWAAYQCYGDPNWTWRSEVGDAQGGTSIRDQYEGISSPLGLALALEELAVQSTWMGAAPLDQLERARHLEARFGALWGGMGAVAEAFAMAYHKAGDRNSAITWYQRALRSNDASASLKAHEHLGNLLARRAWERVDAYRSRPGAPEPGEDDFRQAREELTQALRGLQALAGLQPTAERHSLCGSAWKRLAMIEQRSKDTTAERAALQMAAECYLRAETITMADGLDNVFYPALNRMALELATRGRQRGWKGFDPATCAAVRKSLAEKNRDEPDFWSVVGGVEIDLYESVARRHLADQVEGLLAAYGDLHNRVTGQSEWRSVADQADLVLTPYSQNANAAESAAAMKLLGVLKGYAS
jgi:tetratricopeptide (TPR) repeat protein